MSVKKSYYGAMPDGRKIYLYKIENSNGVSAEFITKGASVNSFICPDKNGRMGDIIAGFDSLSEHINSPIYAGAIVGRYANRIKNGKFILNGKEYSVTKNEDGINCLHGGNEYNSAVWEAEIKSDNSVEFSYISEDNSHGFPGTVNARVTYCLTEQNELEIHYEAVSDKDTVFCMTNHSYFNLGTIAGGDIFDTEVMLCCDYFTPVDENSIPTGEIRSVKESAFDFTQFKKIGRDIISDDIQLKQAKGYDHNFCINGKSGTMRLAAKARDRKSGRGLDVYTDMPGLQFYTGNFMTGEKGKNGIALKPYHGFCFETQYYPDSPNHPEFPQCILKAGEKYESKTVFKVSAENSDI